MAARQRSNRDMMIPGMPCTRAYKRIRARSVTIDEIISKLKSEFRAKVIAHNVAVAALCESSESLISEEPEPKKTRH